MVVQDFIKLCDTVFVLNVDNYIGDSTRSEIEYGERIGKPVYYLETPCCTLVLGTVYSVLDGKL